METKEIVKERELTDEKAEAVSGDEEVQHYCGYCNSLMEFAYKQDYSFPMVYRCPRCGDLCAYKK